MHTSRQFTCCAVFLAALVAQAVLPARADDDKSPAEIEKELLVVLRSDAAAADKAIACKRLAIYGSSDAVPDLAQLLPDPQLSSWARIALEAIPGQAADTALRAAAGSLEGRLLIGAINSIGVRRDAAAVETLAARLQDDDADVASAAAVALGNIATADAARLLRAALADAPPALRSAVAEGCVLCAESRWAEGKLAEAVEIYDQVRAADVPRQRIIEATRGAILARQHDGVPLLVELLRSEDKAMFQLGLGTAREFPEGPVDAALAAELGRAAPERAALIVEAMSDRPETVVLSAVLKAAEQGPKPVRLAAIGALGRVGDATCLATLLDAALDADTDLAHAARGTLAVLPDPNMDVRVIERLANAEGRVYPVLIELVGTRRIDAVPVLLSALEHANGAVRRAALTALGETVSLPRLSVLIAQVVAPKHAEDRGVAEQALKAASIRMPDREACAAELAAAIDRTPSVSTKVTLLEILGAMGGTRALAAVGAAAKSRDAELQDVGSRLLGEWMTVDAAPVLLDLAKTAPVGKYQVRALRGYIRIARQFVMTEPERAEMCAKALAAASQTAEQKLVIDVLKRYPHVETLKLAIQAMKIPAVKDEATEASLAIAHKLGGNRDDVNRLIAGAGFERVKLEIVKAEYGAGSNQKDVTALVRKLAGDLPLIALTAGNYNASFGGDPVPGTPKHLKIQYKINGKPGEASFAENALILLPIPR